jgi:hypothetical protein
MSSNWVYISLSILNFSGIRYLYFVSVYGLRNYVPVNKAYSDVLTCSRLKLDNVQLITPLRKLSLGLFFRVCHELKIKLLVAQGKELSEICCDNESRCCMFIFSLFVVKF